jgi:hypothetical protein
MRREESNSPTYHGGNDLGKAGDERAVEWPSTVVGMAFDSALAPWTPPTVVV